MDSNTTHLSDEQLAAFQDGELSPADSAHLQHCETCGGRLRDAERAAAAYVEYLDSIRGPQLPLPPKPWSSLNRLVAGHQVERRRRLLWWWVPALAAAFGMAAAVVAIHRSGERPSEQATRLLARAAMTELPRHGMISLRTRGRTLLRPAVLAADVPSNGDPEMAHLEMLFQTARYGWPAPLSPRTFQQWRGALPDKRDSVTRVAAPGKKSAYRVRTETATGVLHNAALFLDEESLRPTGGEFEFEGDESVQMEEAPDAAEPAATPSAPAAKEAPEETPVGPADTLRVLAALNELGADAGEPVDVSQDAQHRHVVVHAGALSRERQHQIAAELARLPRVILDLQPAAGNVPPSPAPPQTSTSSIPPALRKRFEDAAGGPVALQELTDRVLETGAQTLARAHAMEVLAETFPPEIEARLSASDRLLLRQLRRRHAAELERLATQIRTAIGPLLNGSSAAPRPTGDNGEAQTWQAGVPSLVAAARDMDQSLNRLLAGSYSQSSGEAMLVRLPSDIQRLEWIIQLQARGE